MTSSGSLPGQPSVEGAPLKNLLRPNATRAAEAYVVGRFGLSHRRACQIVQLCRATQQYRRRRADDTAFRRRLRELAAQRRRFGARRLHILLQREGLVVNHKRTERIYREEGLALRRRRKKTLPATRRVPRASARAKNQVWCIDFVQDALVNGRKLKCFTVVDEYTRECPVIAVDHSMGGAAVCQVLERVVAWRGAPQHITVDNGPEFISKAMDQWAYAHGITLDVIRPGSPSKTPSTKASMASSATNASISIGLSRYVRHGRSSKPIESITTGCGPTVRWGTSRRRGSRGGPRPPVPAIPRSNGLRCTPPIRIRPPVREQPPRFRPGRTRLPGSHAQV